MNNQDIDLTSWITAATESASAPSGVASSPHEAIPVVQIAQDVTQCSTLSTCEPPISPATSLKEILAAYIEKCESNGIRQHTQEWEKIRSFVVGGSTIAVFAGESSKSLIAYVQEKTGLISPMHFGTLPKVIYLNWGNIFEVLIEKIVSRELRCEIVGENSFIPGYQQDGRMYTAYSPDGLTIVDGKICLLEFKCPFSRMPTSKGIPDMYLPQVRMGLDIIDIASHGIFVDAVFRRCMVDNVDYTSSYDASLGQKLPAECSVKSIGMIWFGVDEFRRAQVIVSLRSARKPALVEHIKKVFAGVDAGCMSAADFESFMIQYEHKIITAWYSPVYFPPEMPNLKELEAEFMAHCESSKLTFGAKMGWKLFQMQRSRVEKVPDYCSKHIPKIVQVMDLIRATHDQPAIKKRDLVEAWMSANFPVKGVRRITAEDIDLHAFDLNYSASSRLKQV